MQRNECMWLRHALTAVTYIHIRVGNADCAQAVLRLQQACSSSFLSRKGMESMNRDVALAAKLCKRSGGEGH